MKARPRGPVENSVTRDALIDATEKLMREEGYAAVSTRRIGAQAGVKGPLIHYYFKTIDDLYLAVFRRIAEQGLQRLETALTSEVPLSALWGHTKNPDLAKITIEFMALANHRSAIRTEIAQYTSKARALQIEYMTRHLKTRGIDPAIPIAAVPALMTSISFLLTLESSIGIFVGHAEIEAVMEGWLRSLEKNGTLLLSNPPERS